MKMTSVPGFSWITGTAIWPQLSPATTVLKSNKFASKSCGRKLARFRNNSNKHKQTMCTWPNGMQQDLSVLGSGLSKVRIRWGQNIHHWRCRILTRFTTVKIRHPEMIFEWIKKTTFHRTKPPRLACNIGRRKAQTPSRLPTPWFMCLMLNPTVLPFETTVTLLW